MAAKLPRVSQADVFVWLKAATLYQQFVRPNSSSTLFATKIVQIIDPMTSDQIVQVVTKSRFWYFMKKISKAKRKRCGDAGRERGARPQTTACEELRLLVELRDPSSINGVVDMRYIDDRHRSQPEVIQITKTCSITDRSTYFDVELTRFVMKDGKTNQTSNDDIERDNLRLMQREAGKPNVPTILVLSLCSCSGAHNEPKPNNHDHVFVTTTTTLTPRPQHINSNYESIGKQESPERTRPIHESLPHRKRQHNPANIATPGQNWRPARPLGRRTRNEKTKHQ